jgi:hypothetical protein
VWLHAGAERAWQQRPELLQAGWPIRYWLPAPSGYEALLQPLATALGLLRLAPRGEAQQEDDLKLS